MGKREPAVFLGAEWIWHWRGSIPAAPIRRIYPAHAGHRGTLEVRRSAMVGRRIIPIVNRSSRATRRGVLMAPWSSRSTRLARRIAPIGTSLGLLALTLDLGLRTPPASAQNSGTEGPSTRSTGAASPGTRAIPANTNAGAPAANETPESLSQSIQRRKDFPFPARCDGNTQEMVACLWQRRDRSDLRLRKLLGNEQVLEHWRAARLAVCRRSSERGAGGSIQPLLWLGCENALNDTVIEQITKPLLR